MKETSRPRTMLRGLSCIGTPQRNPLAITEDYSDENMFLTCRASLYRSGTSRKVCRSRGTTIHCCRDPAECITRQHPSTGRGLTAACEEEDIVLHTTCFWQKRLVVHTFPPTCLKCLSYCKYMIFQIKDLKKRTPAAGLSKRRSCAKWSICLPIRRSGRLLPKNREFFL